MESFTLVGALVIALTAVFKKAGLSTKYLPLVAIFIGIGLSLALDGLSMEAGISGLISALTAMGVYSGTRATIK